MSKTRKNAQWPFNSAKAHFAELCKRACAEGPQWVTRNKEAVVVLSATEFERLTAHVRQQKPLVEFFAESPLANSGINLERIPDYGRVKDSDFE